MCDDFLTQARECRKGVFQKCSPTKRAPRQTPAGRKEPDGWDSARSLELVLSYGIFRLRAFLSPAAGNASRWASELCKKQIFDRLHPIHTLKDLKCDSILLTTSIHNHFCQQWKVGKRPPHPGKSKCKVMASLHPAWEYCSLAFFCTETLSPAHS